MKAFVELRSGRKPRVRIRDGKTYVESRTFDTESAASTYTEEFNLQAAQDEAPRTRPGRLTVAGALQAHWDNRIKLLSEGHQRHARAKIFKHLMPWFGDRLVRSLTHDDIRAYAAHQFTRAEVRRRPARAKHRAPQLEAERKQPNVRQGRGYYSVLGDIAILRATLNDLVEKPGSGLLRNPVPRAGAVVKEQSRVHDVQPRKNEAWTREELARGLDLIEAAAPRVFPACYFAAMTGARLGEILALEWRFIDLEGGTAHIAKAKWGKPRDIDLPPTLVAWLAQYRGQWRKQMRRTRLNGLVFPSPRGKHWTSSNFERAFKKARIVLEENGIPALHFHCYRHTFASLSIQHYLRDHGSSDYAWIANQPGHSLEVFLNTYAHLVREKRDLGYLDLRGDRAGAAATARVVALRSRRPRAG